MAVDKKISQLASGAPAQAGDEYVVARSGANFKLTLTNIAASMPPIGATTPNTGSFTSLTNSGNLTFSSTAQRITGDFSNATLANRLAFQTSTTNGNTIVGALPNGTGTNTRLQLFSASDPANASTASMEANATSSLVIINADKTGTGTYLPMTFYTGGSERMRITSGGDVAIGTTAALTGAKFSVDSGSANATTYTTYSARGGSTMAQQQQSTTSVSTSLVTILTPGTGPYTSLCLVFGISGADRFVDLILFSVGTGTVNVINSLSASGTPAARTYAQNSSTLQVSVASGTYTVSVTTIGMGA